MKSSADIKNIIIEKGSLYYTEGGIIVLCTGDGKDEDSFSGVVVYSKEGVGLGNHEDKWRKKAFSYFIGNITMLQ